MRNTRQFSSGANRDTNEDKFNYEGFISPIVLHSFAKYMHANRFLKDGTIRDGDNWQKLFGATIDEHLNVCIDSLLRHVMDLWLNHRGYHETALETTENALNGVLFNTMAYYHGLLMKEKRESE